MATANSRATKSPNSTARNTPNPTAMAAEETPPRKRRPATHVPTLRFAPPSLRLAKETTPRRMGAQDSLPPCRPIHFLRRIAEVRRQANETPTPRRRPPPCPAEETIPRRTTARWLAEDEIPPSGGVSRYNFYTGCEVRRPAEVRPPRRGGDPPPWPAKEKTRRRTQSAAVRG